MDVRQLRYLIAVAEGGSFLHAAEQLHISQPALTKAIKALEQSVQVRLFDRSSRGVSLTVFGERLYSYGKSFVDELERVTRELREERNTPSGSVTIGCPRTVAHLVLPDVTLKFVRSHPAVRMRIMVGYNSDLIAGAARGDFDFVVGLVQGGLGEQGLRYELLFYERLVIAGRTGHPLSLEQKITPAVLKKYPWILPRSGTYRQRFDEMFLAAGLPPPTSNIECGDLTYLRSLLVQSDFLALLSEQSISLECELKVLASFPMDSQFMLRPIGLIFHAHRPLTQAARALAEQVRTICRERGLLGSE
jgi:DNA-binding transcriptional LysR family regulator